MKENAEKFRELDQAELDKQLREGAEQMFRLRFQMSMGQTDGIKKLRSLRKERARILTVLREKGSAPSAAAHPAPLVTKVTSRKKAAPKTAAASAAKSAPRKAAPRKKKGE